MKISFSYEFTALPTRGSWWVVAFGPVKATCSALALSNLIKIARPDGIEPLNLIWLRV